MQWATVWPMGYSVAHGLHCSLPTRGMPGANRGAVAMGTCCTNTQRGDAHLKIWPKRKGSENHDCTVLLCELCRPLEQLVQS